MLDSERKKLYLSLQKLMEEDAIFTSAKLTRKSLAMMLGTNERYLHDMLKEHTGLPYSKYVLSLRLDYACRLLQKQYINFTIEDIALHSGFSSRKTFYRQFRKHYATSPAQFACKAKIGISN